MLDDRKLERTVVSGVAASSDRTPTHTHTHTHTRTHTHTHMHMHMHGERRQRRHHNSIARVQAYSSKAFRSRPLFDVACGLVRSLHPTATRACLDGDHH